MVHEKQLRIARQDDGSYRELLFKVTLGDKGVTEGYVMFAKKIQRQRWAEYELLALSTIAKIFEISIYH